VVQVLSCDNQDLDRVRVQFHAASKPRQSDSNPVAVCDQHAASTGTRRTLAANLYLLNGPSDQAATRWAAPRQNPSGASEISPAVDYYDPRPIGNSYDLSMKSTRVDKAIPDWTVCRRPNPTSSDAGKSKPSRDGPRVRQLPPSIPTKAEVLARFNEQSSNGEPSADLRKNSVHGKKHVFSGNIHSQQMRGCMLAA
jgi:hypothetical protein